MQFKITIGLSSFHAILYCFLLLVLPAIAQSQHSVNELNLQQAIDISLANNKKLKIYNAQTTISKLTEQDYKNEKLPDIAFVSSLHVLDNLHQYESGIMQPSTSYETPRFKYNFTLEAEIPLYTGGRLQYEDKKAEINTEVASLKLHKQQREIRLAVTTAFLQALHIQKQQNLLHDKMHEDSVVIAQSEKLRKNGLVTNNDVLRTKLLLSNHQMSLSDLNKDLDILIHQVKTLLALPEDYSISLYTLDLITDLPAQTVDLMELSAQSKANSETHQIAQKDVELRQWDKKLTKSNILPQVSLGAEYGYNYPNFMFFPPVEHLYRFGSVGVNLKIPLSNLYKNKVKTHIAQEHLRVAQLQVDESEELIQHEVFAAKKRLEEAGKKITIAHQAIDQAKENYRIVRLKYSNQLSLLTELVDADNAYLEAQTQLISLQINEQLKYHQLQYILGNL